MTRRLARILRATPPTVADSSTALAVAVLSVVATAPADVIGAGRPDALGWALAVLAALPVALRRRYPLAVLCGCALSLTVFYALGNKSSFTQFGTLIAMYTVAARGTPRRAVIAGCATFLAVSCGAGYGVVTGWPNYLAGAAQLATAVAIGVAVRGRAEHLAERAELAEQRATEHRLRAEQAVADERIRIAGELHDVIAHHLSIIAVQSGLAGYVLDSDPDTARTALHTVSAATTESLDELRRMLRVLRPPANDTEPEPCYAPQPGLADLAGLTERVRASGVAVRLVVSGVRDGVPAGPALCAYRVAQEALTNVLKHTDGASALVHLDCAEHELTLRVVDTGPATGEPGAVSGGYGHLGMRERARTYGGTVEFGPRPGGGFGVLLRLPLPVGQAPKLEPQA